jgi:hypothetical protein
VQLRKLVERNDVRIAALHSPRPSTGTPDSGDVLNHSLTEAIDHFITCVQKRERSPLSFLNTAPIADVGWAAQILAKTGTPVTLPLDPNLTAQHL